MLLWNILLPTHFVFRFVFLLLFLCTQIRPDLLFYQNVDDLLGGDGEEEEEEGSVAQSIRSPSLVALTGPSPTPDLVNTDGTLMLFPGNSSSRTG